jgi:uncharacterized protein (TIGR03067 family)
MTLRVLAVLIVGALVAVEGTGGDKKDPEAIQGTWKVVSLEDGGKEVPKDALDQAAPKLIFKGDKYTFTAMDKTVEEGTFKLGAAKDLKTIDLAITEGNDKGKTQVGIYQLSGDTLKVCFAVPGDKDRPTTFASKAEPRTLLVVLKKEKK